MSSMVSGSGIPLVSGSSSTKPPATKARKPGEGEEKTVFTSVTRHLPFLAVLMTLDQPKMMSGSSSQMAASL